MLNTAFVLVHAAAATLAFVAGALAVPGGRFLGTYRVAVVVMAVALVPAVLVDWAVTDPVARAVFGGLLLLAGAVVVRAELAVRSRPERTGGVCAAYLGHLGFTLIALADGFAVVTAIRAGAPGWLVGLGAAAVVGAGHAAVRVAIRRLVVVPAIGEPVGAELTQVVTSLTASNPLAGVSTAVSGACSGHDRQQQDRQPVARPRPAHADRGAGRTDADLAGPHRRRPS